MIAILDGDIPVYTTCYACSEETEWYKVKHTADMVVRSVLKKAKATHYTGFLTHGASNFRVQRATTWPYKGQRGTNKEKPRWYDEVRRHYEEVWNFQVMRGIEADDALTICAKHFSNLKMPWVICTKDKDLHQYPGNHFDMNVNKHMTISPEKAQYNLWKQVMIGDVGTDNIPGLSHSALYETREEIHNQRISMSDLSKSEKLKQMKRAQRDLLYGEATVKKLLDSWDVEDYPTKVFQLYVDAYEDPDFGEYRFYETFDLVYMLVDKPSHVELTFDIYPFDGKTITTISEFEDETDETDETNEAAY